MKRCIYVKLISIDSRYLLPVLVYTLLPERQIYQSQPALMDQQRRSSMTITDTWQAAVYYFLVCIVTIKHY